MTSPLPTHANRTQPRKVGRYTLFDEIAAGGMATVHLGRMGGQAGFSKTVAIKRLHPHLARNPEFVRMIVDEARLVARVQHPNVVAMLDIVSVDDDVLLILEYIHGESLWHLLHASRTRGIHIPPRIVATAMVNTLHGLHAAHEATDEQGNPLGIVHRDVSPQNVLLGVDGVARVLDFGVAKATGRLQTTNEGQLKGKLSYMAPEQVRGEPIDRRTDIYAAACVLWGSLVGRRLVNGANEAEILNNVLAGGFARPSTHVDGITPAMDAVVMRGLEARPDARFETAREMAMAVEAAFGIVSPYEVGEWVKALGNEGIADRSSRIREMESTSDVRVTLDEAGMPIVGRTSGTHLLNNFFPTPSTPSVTPSGVSTQGNTIVSQPPSQPGYAQPHTAGHEFGVTRMHVYPPGAASSHSMGQLPSHPPLEASVASAKQPRRRRGVLLTGIFFFLVSLVIIFVVLTRAAPAGWPLSKTHASEPPPATALPASPTNPATVPSAVKSVELPSVAPTDLPMALDDPPPTAPTTKATAAPSTSTSAAAKPAWRPPSRSAPKPSAAPNCDSPFFVDSDGIKRIRPECM